MTKKRILELADFFYSCDSTRDIPLRICCETGRYSGFSLDREEFVSLFLILTRSEHLKEDLQAFVEAMDAK
jgi:hypothetical protein